LLRESLRNRGLGPRQLRGGMADGDLRAQRVGLGLQILASGAAAMTPVVAGDEGVAQDREQPGADARALFERVPGAVGSDDDVLDQVLGLGRVAGHAQSGSVERVELRERRALELLACGRLHRVWRATSGPPSLFHAAPGRHRRGRRGRRNPYSPGPSSEARLAAKVSYSNEKPVAWSLSGSARCPPRSTASAISPRAAFIANRGSATRAGRRSACASVRVNSRLVTGVGAERLYAPRQSGCSSRWRTARATSRRSIQDMYCEPSPSWAPRPRRNGSNSLAKAPPSGSSTIPKRMRTTRTPNAVARSASASHVPVTSARKSCPGASSSCSGV